MQESYQFRTNFLHEKDNFSFRNPCPKKELQSENLLPVQNYIIANGKTGIFCNNEQTFSHKANLWNFLKNCSNEIRSNEIRSNEIRIRREPPVIDYRKTVFFFF